MFGPRPSTLPICPVGPCSMQALLVGISGVKERALYSIFEMPAPTTPHPCRENNCTSGGIQTGSHPTARTGAAPVGGARGHTPLAPLRRHLLLLPALAHPFPGGGQCFSPLLALGTLLLLPLFLDLISECTRIKEDPWWQEPGAWQWVVVGGGGVCAGSLGRDFMWRSEMSPWATWISLGAKWGGASTNPDL